MAKKKKKIAFQELIIRYLVLLVLAIPGYQFFQFIFQPLTTYPVYWFLDIFYEASLEASTIFITGCEEVEVAGACVAGSAYLLFLILNLATPNIKVVKRLKLLGIAFGSFLVLNIIRIIILVALHVHGSPAFDIVHSFFWYFISVVFVVAVWFFEVKRFDIKGIPFYSDVRYLLKEVKNKRD